MLDTPLCQAFYVGRRLLEKGVYQTWSIFEGIYQNRAFIKENTVLRFLYLGSVSEHFPIVGGWGSHVLSFTVRNH